MPTEDKAAIDIWSIPHFLAGFLIGVPALRLGLDFLPTLAAVYVVTLSFEIVEHAFKVKESPANNVCDRLLEGAGGCLSFLAFQNLAPTTVDALLWTSLAVHLAVIIPGWRRYLRRHA